MRQQVAELPDVNWKSYMECVEKIVRQHSAVYQRTRRRGGGKEPATPTKMVRLSVCLFVSSDPCEIAEVRKWKRQLSTNFSS